jgi:large subunit ribosomal protein L32
MAKRSTPKKQQANSQSSRRYKTFQKKAQKRLLDLTAISNCSKCKEPKLAHAACSTCGTYKGRTVIDKDKEMDKITKVKA